MNFSSHGKLVYNQQGDNWYIEVDLEISRYYRKQIPFMTNKQRYAPHISVVRNEPLFLKTLSPNKFDGLDFNFTYSHHIYCNNVYVWIAAECQDAEDFRIFLGLPPFSPVTQSPTLEHKFHITIGNMKENLNEKENRQY